MNFNMSRDYPVSGTKYKIQFDDLFVSQITIIYWFRVLSGAVQWQSIGLPWLFLVIVHRKFHWDCPLDWLSGWTVTGFVIGQSPEISTNFQFSGVDSNGCPAGVHWKMWGSVKTSLFLVHFFFFPIKFIPTLQFYSIQLRQRMLNEHFHEVVSLYQSSDTHFLMNRLMQQQS